jgi:O-methyltransferase
MATYLFYEKLSKEFIKFYYKFPILRPYLAYIPKIYFFFKPRFSGWGMKSAHEFPWNDEYQGEVFRKACIDVKNHREYDSGKIANSKIMDQLMWRHWIISYATKHAIEFSQGNNFNFVECGVANGFTTFFTLREIVGNKKSVNNFSMHLYDAWNAMRKNDLFENESSHVGNYANLNVEITKKNLDEFKDNLVYHIGYIPDTFHTIPEAPNSIIYLHIDLNSAKTTLETLEFFFPRLTRGGVIVFDDYGQIEYNETKKIVDKFFSDKPGILQKLPTGQAIFFR